MPCEYFLYKCFLLADEPLIVYELKTADWSCYMCKKCFPSSVESVEQEVDGEPRTLCGNCWEDFQEFTLGEAYLKQRKLETTEKKDASEHG
ncbi:MAG: hypothetical protein FWD53_02315 [Phycisphaerales bacterium]|nr:hypothetical protein [Phycisphaerales bacterium]